MTSTNTSPKRELSRAAALPLLDGARLDAEARALLADRSATLDGDVQDALALSHQQRIMLQSQLDQGALSGLERTRALREVRRRETHSVALMISLERLVQTIVAELARTRFGSAWARSEMDDLRQDGMVVALEAVASFDPARGPSVSHWVARQVRNSMHEKIATAGGVTSPRAWIRVGRVARGILSDAELHGRQLSIAELQDAVIARFREKTRARIAARNPHMTEAELEAEVHDKLSRESVFSAAKQLQAVLASSATVLSLDAPVGDDGLTRYDLLGGTTTADEAEEVGLLDIVETALRGLPPAHVAAVWQRYGQNVPLRKIAASMGLEWTHVRDIAEAGKARVVAPHAQFASFAPGILRNFGAAPTEAAGGGGRAAAALARRLPVIAQG